MDDIAAFSLRIRNARCFSRVRVDDGCSGSFSISSLVAFLNTKGLFQDVSYFEEIGDYFPVIDIIIKAYLCT